MKNLKKSLALVLALVMVFSLCIFANAAFEDQDAIGAKYEEAASVMNGLGILKGDENGVFNPQGNLTRGQACKIIAYMKLGNTLAEKLTVSAAPFDDVKVTDWEAPFIAYCKAQKIVSGYGDGNFGKDDYLTGYQFGKMLLVALGFGTNGEYEGEGWEINVTEDALDNGIYPKVTLEGATENIISRELAAQLAFNGLNYSATTAVKHVVKDNNGTPDNTADDKIMTFDTLVEAYLVANSNDNYAYGGTKEIKTGSLGAINYGLARNDGVSTADGLVGHKWTVNGKDITGVYVEDTLVEKFPAGTTSGTIVKALNVTAAFNKTVDLYRNGEYKSTLTADQVKGYVGSTTPVVAPTVLYKTTDGNYKLMATCEYLAKVKTVTKQIGLDAGKDQVVFTVFDDATGYDVTLGSLVATGTYKVGDLYVVAPYGDNHAATKFLSIKTPETVEGKVTGTGTGYVRVDGTKYGFGLFVKQLCASAFDYNTSTYVAYLDSTGAIVGYDVKATAAPAATFDGILYLTNAQAKVTSAVSNLFGSTTFAAEAKANVFLAGEGAAKVVDLYIGTTTDKTTGAVTAAFLGKASTTAVAQIPVNSTGVYTMKAGATAGPSELDMVAGFYGYNVVDGAYVLTKIIEATGQTGLDVTLQAKKAAVITGKYADAATTVNVYNYDAVAKCVTKTAYTGIADYPAVAKTFEDASCIINVTYAKNAAGTSDTNLITNIDIYTNVNTPTTTPVNYAYYVGAGEYYAAGQAYQAFYVNGEKVEYKLTAGTPEAGKVYDLVVAADGTASLKTTGTPAVVAEKCTSTGVVSYVGETYVVIDSGVYYYGTNFQAYNVKATGFGAADTLKVGDYVKFDHAVLLGTDTIAIAYIATAPVAE